MWARACVCMCVCAMCLCLTHTGVHLHRLEGLASDTCVRHPFLVVMPQHVPQCFAGAGGELDKNEGAHASEPLAAASSYSWQQATVSVSAVECVRALGSFLGAMPGGTLGVEGEVVNTAVRVRHARASCSCVMHLLEGMGGTEGTCLRALAREHAGSVGAAV